MHWPLNRCACVIAIVVSGITATSPETTAAQQKHLLRTDRCRACVVDVQHVVTLNGHDSIGGVSPTPTLVRLPSGEYIASNWFNKGGLLVFEADGRPTRTIGREGGGPGEFRSVHAVETVGEHLYVVDRGNSKISLLDRTGQLLNETKVDFSIQSIVPLRDGFIVGSELHTAESVGLPLHVVSGDGELIRSFGDSSGVYGPGLGGIRMRRIIHPGKDGTFWSAREGEYVIEQWTTSGTLLQRFDRRVRWFPPADPLHRISLDPDSPPQAKMVDFRVDPSGLLWVLIRYPAADWRSSLEKVEGTFPNGVVMYRTTNPEGLWTTILEIIDIESRSVLFTRRYSPMFLGFLGDGTLYSYTEKYGWVGRYDVWKFNLQNLKVSGEKR